MKVIDSDFTLTEFTKEEFPSAVVFSELQIAHIKNEIATAALEKLQIAFNPLSTSREQFQMEHEYYRGKIEGLRYLITLHEDNKELLWSSEAREK